MPPSTRLAFLSDLRAAETAARSGVGKGTIANANTSWDLWRQFCRELNHDPHLQSVSDPILLLQVFAARVRDGSLTGHKPVHAGTVATRLRDVGQTLSLLGTPDPRMNPSGSLDLRLARQLRHYSLADPPPARAPPLSLSVLHYIVHNCYRSRRVVPHATQACTDLIIIAYFFLMRPGEFCETATAHPFRFCDVALYNQGTRIDTATAREPALYAATHILLTFTTQKNGVRGERIGQGCSGDPFLCPVKAVVRRLIHLRRCGAGPTTPLHHYQHNPDQAHPNNFYKLTATTITRHLRLAVAALNLAALPLEAVSARCLRATGATALLLSKIDPDLIRLLGRWQSDAMLCYLHVQSAAIKHNLAQVMLTSDPTAEPSLPAGSLSTTTLAVH